MVDGINNIASQIFSKLNSQDSNGTDDKIEASIWNKFVSDKGGKEINNYIKKENAVKSIISYLTNMSKKLGCTVEELANRWLGKSEANPSEISGEKSKLNSKSVDVPAIVYEEAYTFEDVSEQETENASKSLNQSLQLISDVANGKYQYSVVTNDNNDRKEIRLKDGRTIIVDYDTDKEGKARIGNFTVNIGGTNYNGNDNSMYFSICGYCSQGSSTSAVNDSDFQALVKVISGILGEDIET